MRRLRKFTVTSQSCKTEKITIENLVDQKKDKTSLILLGWIVQLIVWILAVAVSMTVGSAPEQVSPPTSSPSQPSVRPSPSDGTSCWYRRRPPTAFPHSRQRPPQQAQSPREQRKSPRGVPSSQRARTPRHSSPARTPSGRPHRGDCVDRPGLMK